MTADRVNSLAWFFLGTMILFIYLSRWFAFSGLLGQAFAITSFVVYPITIGMLLFTGYVMDATESDEPNEIHKLEQVWIYTGKMILFCAGVLMLVEFTSKWRSIPEQLMTMNNLLTLYCYPVSSITFFWISGQMSRLNRFNSLRPSTS